MTYRCFKRWIKANAVWLTDGQLISCARIEALLDYHPIRRRSVWKDIEATVFNSIIVPAEKRRKEWKK